MFIIKAMNLNDWRVWAKALTLIVLFFGAIDFFKRGIDGVVQKRMRMYRWWYFLNEYSLESDIDERIISGGRATLIGSLYLIFGLFLLAVTVFVAIFVPPIS